jgi:hypothetical protein
MIAFSYQEMVFGIPVYRYLPRLEGNSRMRPSDQISSSGARIARIPDLSLATEGI